MASVSNSNVNNPLVKKKRFIIVKRKAVEYEEDVAKDDDRDDLSGSRLSEYIEQLTEQEIIVMKIASDHLKTSFDLEKSSGYLQYLRGRGQR